MKSLVTKELRVTLVLTEGEATMLKDLVQNPACDPQEESPDIAMFRESLFGMLREAVGSSELFNGGLRHD